MKIGDFSRTFSGVSVFRLFSCCVIGCLLLCTHQPVWAGNKKMVEERVEDLKALNNQLLEQVRDVPKNGQIDLKAKVQPSGDGEITFDIYHQKVTPTKEENLTIGVPEK